eukprot:6198023-Pleurochrysis_carterae.AAC.1
MHATHRTTEDQWEHVQLFQKTTKLKPDGASETSLTNSRSKVICKVAHTSKRERATGATPRAALQSCSADVGHAGSGTAAVF